jgi:hypothetical protein
MQPLGGTGEVQLVGDRREVAQVPEVSIHNQQLSRLSLDGAAASADDRGNGGLR